MSSDNRQIVELFKQGMTAAEIALSLGYAVESVEYVLTHDAEAVAEIKKASLEVKPEFNLDDAYKAQQKAAFDKLVSLMQNAENEKTQAQAAFYLLDGAQGLKKPKQITNNILAIGNFNETLVEVKRRAKQLADRCIELDAKQAVTG